jgi:hypothetical protein
MCLIHNIIYIIATLIMYKPAHYMPLQISPVDLYQHNIITYYIIHVQQQFKKTAMIVAPQNTIHTSVKTTTSPTTFPYMSSIDFALASTEARSFSVVSTRASITTASLEKVDLLYVDNGGGSLNKQIKNRQT